MKNKFISTKMQGVSMTRVTQPQRQSSLKEEGKP